EPMLDGFSSGSRSIFFLAVVVCAAVRVSAQEMSRPVPALPTPTPQQYRILSQPDAPLRISSAQVSWAIPGDQRGVQVYVVVENVGQRAVRAYTTRRDLNSGDASKACLSNPRLSAEGLLP